MVLTENLVVADRFRLVRMIGKGGMGSVWRAVHLGLDTPCALKFIEGELANVAEAHARFEREAKAAAQLRSPNVVQIFDHGVWQGHPYIAMELLEGEDLGKRLAKNGGRLPAADVNFVVQQVCRALSRAHQAGVVHRDMKPDNIFVVKDDDRDIVKILDFGVAKSAAAALDGSNTKTGAMLGTPYYMSPEQAQGIKTVDARSDLWSLAVIVFQCLTGRLPFESEALGDLLVKIIVSPVPTPSHYYPLVPIGFDAWWAKAADRNPDNRHQTAKLFAESLALALGQSSATDMTARLQRPSERPGNVNATAMMMNAPGTEVYANVPNTPNPAAPTANPGNPGNPGAHTAAMPMASTPHPMNTPQGMMHPGHAQPHQQPAAMQSSPGYMQTPQATTGNPVAATFSGLEPGAGVPKKGTPVALFVGIGVLALVGLGLGGVALVKGRGGGAAAGGGGDPTTTSASVASTAPPPADSSALAAASAGASAHPADTAAVDPASSASSAAAAAGSAAAAASSVAAAGTPPAAGNPGTHRPAAPIAGNAGKPAAPVAVAVAPPKAATPPTPPATPPVTPAAGAKPAAAPTQKAVPLGF